MSATATVEEIDISDSESESNVPRAGNAEDQTALLHAKTLRLDDVRAPTVEIEKVKAPVDQAQEWKEKYEELQKKLELLELERKSVPKSTPPATPTQKAVFSPSPSPASTGSAGSGAKGLPLPAVKAHVSLQPPPPKQVSPVVVPKQVCPAKASPSTAPTESKAPTVEASAAPAAPESQIREGEEELAQQMDLSDEESSFCFCIFLCLWNLGWCWR